MDDPDAMKAVGKVWVHWLEYGKTDDSVTEGKNDFGEIGYGGPAPPDGQHTYIFKGYALDTVLDLKEGYSKQELENEMKGQNKLFARNEYMTSVIFDGSKNLIGKVVPVKIKNSNQNSLFGEIDLNNKFIAA